MNIDKEKQKIIEALQDRDEEWLIVAIQKLLAIAPAEPFSNEHKAILMERIESYEKDPGNVISFDDLKQTFRNNSRWL